MLAGISHDLRTPLAACGWKPNERQRRGGATQHGLDIDQLDAIIDKFMDYARPARRTCARCRCPADRQGGATFRDPSEIRINSKVAIDLKVMADEIELGRVFANVFENARRYAAAATTPASPWSASAMCARSWVICTVRDKGRAVAPKSCRS